MRNIKSKNPLTIYEELKMPSLIKPEQIIHFLQKTPKEHIYQRPAKGGGKWDFVTGIYVKKSLNYAFGFMWSSEVKEVKEKHGQVIATVRITIHDPKDGHVLLWKEDIGKKDIVFKKNTTDPLDYGNDEKAAVTDGIKRCASQFGIASDVYGKEEFKNIQLEKVVDGPTTPEEINEAKEMDRIKEYIKNAKTIDELKRVYASITDPDMDELYAERYKALGGEKQND